jgi:GNAT superfamily N-acetyltransferase
MTKAPNRTIGPAMTFKIRLSKLADAPLLPAVEQSAGTAFRDIPSLAWVADLPDQPVEKHLVRIATGTSWIAIEDAGLVIGFVIAEPVGSEFHIDELAVRRERQRSGCGRALLNEALTWAGTRGFVTATLTTFRDVPWNEPFYRRMGFRLLAGGEIGHRLEEELLGEVERGLPRERRCAMRLDLR